MKEIVEYVDCLKVGDAQMHKNMAAFPLLGNDSGLEYIVFDDAVNSGLKVSETETVERLHFNNQTGKEVLILQGEYVEGGRQNRMVAQNIYMAKNFDRAVPVRCVEQRRWSYNEPFPEIEEEFPTFPHYIGFPGPRPRHREPVFHSSRSRATPRVYAAAFDQSRVWSEVNHLASTLGVHSPTDNIGDAFKQRREELEDYLAHFSYSPGSVGLVIVTQQNGSKSYGADIFDQSRTMEKNFKKLAESYALEALRRGEGVEVTVDEILGFLGHLRYANFSERRPVSLGRDFLIKSNNAEGLALVYENTPLYLSCVDRAQYPQQDFPRPRQNQISTGFYRIR